MGEDVREEDERRMRKRGREKGEHYVHIAYRRHDYTSWVEA